MSEEILRALMQLFALITKQDGGLEESEKEYVLHFLRSQLGDEGVEEYYQLFLEAAATRAEPRPERKKLTSMLDSVRTLSVCKRINKTLEQRQKYIVILRLLELVAADGNLSRQRHSIIETAAEIFNLTPAELKSAEYFVTLNGEGEAELSDKLVSYSHKKGFLPFRGKTDQAEFHFLRIPSQELYFMRYTGPGEVNLNGLAIHSGSIYIFPKGGAVRTSTGQPFYYSDLSGRFLEKEGASRLSFQALNLSYRFKNGVTGLRNISFAASQGNLIGIMGSSGSGKTTLMNVLSGIEKPSGGSVSVNGMNVHGGHEALEGVMGYVPQDDLLIEDLTVFENIWYNARLCFRNLSPEEIRRRSDEVLANLGLDTIRDLKVGSVFNKTISGGQRKRLNIALELIREPSILFVDEPTSGLSSRDSENVMDLLRELSLKGKLVFVVIHQPSSELFKMFDRVVILDQGGYLVYYGNPVEAVIWFKKIDEQIHADRGECPTCGNINPETIFSILEARVLDEYGNYTPQRKLPPEKWESLFREQREDSLKKGAKEAPPKNLNRPSWKEQLKVFLLRDVKSKIRNHQYMRISLLEAPLLGFILAYIIRYISDPASGRYVFRENDNIPVYIFMTVIVAVFLGLTISAEEIFRDRRILRRERFLNLSRSAYLMSKTTVLFGISAIQALLFVLVANNILEIRMMGTHYFFALFSVAACSNMLGLNISSSFNSAVTIYIVIPLIIIPMMVLSGAMFSFEKLNSTISRVDKVPVIAEIMPTKWAYEALMVHQFMKNPYQVNFYDLDKDIVNSDFMISWEIPELEEKLNRIREGIINEEFPAQDDSELRVLRNEVLVEAARSRQPVRPMAGTFQPEEMTLDSLRKVEVFLEGLKEEYLEVFRRNSQSKNNKVKNLIRERESAYFRYLNDYHNESLADRVRKIYEKQKLVEYDDHLVRLIDPVYLDPVPDHLLDFRSQLFAPRKFFAGRYYYTYNFNMVVLWMITLFLYIMLYFDVLRRVVNRSYPLIKSVKRMTDAKS